LLKKDGDCGGNCELKIKERMNHDHVTGLSIAWINGENSRTEHYGLLEAGTDRSVDHDSIFRACSAIMDVKIK